MRLLHSPSTALEPSPALRGLSHKKQDHPLQYFSCQQHQRKKHLVTLNHLWTSWGINPGLRRATALLSAPSWCLCRGEGPSGRDFKDVQEWADPLEKLPEQGQGCGGCAVQWLLNSGCNLELQVLISLTQECESIIFSQEQSRGICCPSLCPVPGKLWRSNLSPGKGLWVSPWSTGRTLGCHRTHMALLQTSSAATLISLTLCFFGAAQTHFLLFFCTTGCLIKERTQPL